MFFASIPGLSEVKQLLTGSVQRNHIAHAQLFLGPEGGGALPLALAYAAYVNCLAPTETDSCGTCSSCSKIHKHVHPDVHYVMPVTTTKAFPKDVVAQKFLPDWRQFITDEPFGTIHDWTQHIGSENKQAAIAREEGRLLVRTLSLKAFEAKWKVMLIWLPEFMHPATANALLKILEEPPQQTLFLLVSASADRLLPTIKSRCQTVKVRPFSEEETAGFLAGKLGVNPDRALQIAQLSEGNLQAAKALSAEVDNDYFDIFQRWMRAAYAGNLATIVQMSDEFQKMGRENQKNFFQFALTLIRKCILAGIDPVLATGSTPQEQEFIRKFGTVLNALNRDELARELSEAQYHIERNANPKILFTDLSLTAGTLLRRKLAAA